MVDALKVYKEEAKTLPDKIMIYRDGVGGPTFETKLIKTEVNNVITAIRSAKNGYNPEIVYTLVN